MFKTSENTLKLQVYLEGLEPGEELSFHKIEIDTKIKMNQNGKSKLRTALKRAKIEYLSMKGYGIKLANADLSIECTTRKLEKIGKSVKRAKRTHKNIYKKFYDEMNEKDKRHINVVGACFGAIQLAFEQGKLIVKEKKDSKMISIPIPELK